MKFSRLLILGVACITSAQPYNHVHRHLSQRATPVEKNEKASSVSAETAVVTVFMLNGKVISSNDVETCIKESKCMIAKDASQPDSLPDDGQGQKSSSSSVDVITDQASPTLSITPTPTQASTAIEEAPASVNHAPAIPDLKDDQVLDHEKAVTDVKEQDKKDYKDDFLNIIAVNRLFPSGQIDCSEFPSAYGAVPTDWNGLHGWTGVQKTPGYSMSLNAINDIQTAVAGEGCVPGSFCSYACPAGYQKSQWPSAQGATGQSIGGLFCNHRGKLELSRLSQRQLCTPGVGNIRVSNSHHKNVAICRTDYPGTEAETIPLNVLPGETVKVTCPDSKDYYRTWENAPTSAQYYINPSGYNVNEACTWGSSGLNIGNWAPVNMGVGQGDSGLTYVSLFPNVPTNPDGVLDFNIDIIGDVSGSCSYRDGKYYKDGVPSPTGCTVSHFLPWGYMLLISKVGVNGLAVFQFS